MVEEIATVVKVSHEGLWLETKVVTTCQSCSASDTCGSGIVAKSFTKRPYPFFMLHNENSADLLPGQRVKIGITEGVLVKSALMVYLLPLLAFVVATAVAFWAGLSEGGQLFSGLLGGAAGFAVSRQYSIRTGQQQPVQLLEVLPELGLTQS